MATFKSPKFPHLTLQDDKGVWAQFKDGEAEVSDAAALKRLRALPDEYGVSEVKAAGGQKAGGQKDPGDGDGK